MKYKNDKKSATAICEEYKHLEGMILIKQNDQYEFVEAVSLYPTEKKEKTTFIKRFKVYRNKEKALELYNGSDYNIIVVLKIDSILHFKELKNFIKDWPVYKYHFSPLNIAAK